jgi:fructoselysine/glucoselysine PTS system EIID component
MNEAQEKKYLPEPPLAAMFLRSFFMQAAWNYERNQNFGFLFTLMPALRRIYPDREKLKAAALRHFVLVNTQPYMGGFVAGNVAGMEARASLAPAPEAALKAMPGVKQALATSFASIGDRVFWGRLKPMTTQLCLLVWASIGFYGWFFTSDASAAAPAALLAGPLAGILLYSAASLYVRYTGLRCGWDCGGTSSCGLDRVDWPAVIRRLSLAGFGLSLALALLAALLLVKLPGSEAGHAGLPARLALAAGVLALHRLARAAGRSVLAAAGLVLALSVLLFGALGLEAPRIFI